MATLWNYTSNKVTWFTNLLIKKSQEELKEENKENSASQIQNEVSSAIKIQAHYRGYLVRKMFSLEIMSKRMKIPILKYFLPDFERNVEIIGNFTDPKWKVAIKMDFCPIRKIFYTDFLLLNKEKLQKKVTLKFNFLIDGKFQISANYQAHKGKSKTYNMITLHQTKKSASKLNAQRLKRKWPENQYKKIGNISTNYEEVQTPLSSGNSPQRMSQSPLLLGSFSNKQKLILQSYGNMLPNPNTRSEDPAMSCDFMFIGDHVCGVADGVSQWKSFKINPRYFTEQLLKATALELEFLMESEELYSCDQMSLKALKHGYETVEQAGSSTIIFYFIHNSALHMSYIGDSQLMVLRPLQNKEEEITGFTIIFKTKPNCYSFNAPCQLIKWPEQTFVKTLEPSLSRKLQQLIQAATDGKVTQPEDVVQCKVPIKEKDIIICGSDGFFDNLSEQETRDIIFKEHEKGVEHLAMTLNRQCWENSCDEYYESPFQKEAMKHNKMYYGGKPDDCTVIVSKVVNSWKAKDSVAMPTDYKL